MAPQLVIAEAPYKIYPGGVIALPCSSWLGPARGSLTTEADPLSVCGTVVRDTQQSTTSIWDDEFAAYAEVDDTLVIPVTAIPFEPGFSYVVWVSYRCEGDWPIIVDHPGLRQCYPHEFRAVCGLGTHGHEFWTEVNPFLITSNFLRAAPYYMCANHFSFDGNVVEDSDPNLIIRAFADPDSTIEWLLDQLVLLPIPYSVSDMQRFISSNFVGDVQADDGADGGDDGGDWTRTTQSPKDPGVDDFPVGDYQRKIDGDDAEYLWILSSTDGVNLSDSVEALAHAYSLHGARSKEAHVYTLDEFSRTTACVSSTYNLGITPEGFGWGAGGTASAGFPFPYCIHADGSQAVMQMGQGTGGLLSISNGGLALPSNLRGAQFSQYDGVSWSGRFRLNAHANWRSSPFLGGLPDNQTVRLSLQGVGGGLLIFVRFDLRDFEWTLQRTGVGPTTIIDGPNDVSSWYSDFEWVGWRIELQRSLLRIRIWEWTAGEPGAWDYEDFIPVVSGGTVFTYPYTGVSDATLAAQLHREYSPFLNFNMQNTGPSPYSQPGQLYVDDWKLERLAPGGPPTDMHVRVERPHGTTFDEVTIPWGAQYFVYWGQADWTEADIGGGVFPITFSERVWNEVGGPELQRADSGIWWFRVKPGGIVSMNWRSSDRRGAANRMLVGDS